MGSWAAKPPMTYSMVVDCAGVGLERSRIFLYKLRMARSKRNPAQALRCGLFDSLEDTAQLPLQLLPESVPTSLVAGAPPEHDARKSTDNRYANRNCFFIVVPSLSCRYSHLRKDDRNDKRHNPR